jgi:hypothetical protein
LLGATLVAIERGLPFEAAVRHGVAYAAASVAHPVAGYADVSLFAELAGEPMDHPHRCERVSASAACVAERNDGAVNSGLRGRGTQ